MDELAEENFIPDYDEDVCFPVDCHSNSGNEEQISTGVEMVDSSDRPSLDSSDGYSLKKTKPRRKCPVCERRFTHVKRHVIAAHLPWYSVPETACFACQYQVSQLRQMKDHTHHNNFKKKQWLLLINGLFFMLARFLSVYRTEDLPDLVNAPLIKVTEAERNFMNLYAEESKSFSLSRLIHWRPLAYLVSLLTEEEQVTIRNNCVYRTNITK